ncbi:MAG: hypothetical protein Q8835_03185, partial [Sweet potato little leaf phytoplasma]|nr:hypothetical protein [Sweet potato little leaf phytoplasma]
KKTRPLGIPTIKDRLMQKCLEQLLTPYFENIFSDLEPKNPQMISFSSFLTFFLYFPFDFVESKYPRVLPDPCSSRLLFYRN